MLRFACFALLMAFASAGNITFTNCGSVGVPVTVDVQDCDAIQCVLKKGRAYEIQTAFQPKSNSESLIVNVNFMGNIVPTPIVEKDACEGLATGCPYKGGELNNHRITINISNDWIETNARVGLKLRNKEGVVEVCIATVVRITA